MYSINKPWIVLLAGLASSGKDSIINYLTKDPYNYINFDEGRMLRAIYAIVKDSLMFASMGEKFNGGVLSNILSDLDSINVLLESYGILRNSNNFDRHEVIALAEIFRHFDPNFWPKMEMTYHKLNNDKVYCGSIVGDRSLSYYIENFNVFSVNLICESSDLDVKRQKTKDSRTLFTSRSLDIRYSIRNSKPTLTQDIADHISQEFYKHLEMLRNPKTIEFSNI